jgi:hypothetical protein
MPRRQEAPRVNKKVLVAALAGIAGYLGWKRMQAEKAEQDLWAEATDEVPPSTVR